MSKKLKISKANLSWAIPALFGAIIGVLAILPESDTLQYGVYDAFLRLKPPVAQDERVLLVDIDDWSIQRVGSYPWPRDLIADAILGLKEFGAHSVVFDIEYLEKSPPGINLDYLRYGLPNDFDEAYSSMVGRAGDFESVFRVSPSQGPERLQDMMLGVRDDISRLEEQALSVARDNDVYFAQALKLFGNAFMTLHYPEEAAMQVEISEAQRSLVEGAFAYPIRGIDNVKLKQREYSVPLLPLLEVAKGIGFTNVAIDADGKRRRIPLVVEVDGKAYLQLALRPIAEYLGDPAIEVRPDRIAFTGAELDGKKFDFSIPLDEAGNMTIFWPAGPYVEAFKPHLPVAAILEADSAETIIAQNISFLATQELWKKASAIAGGSMGDAETLATGLLWLQKAKQDALASGAAEDFDYYVSIKKDFFAMIEEFIAMDPMKPFLEIVERAKVDAPGDALEQFDAHSEQAGIAVAEIAKTYAALKEIRGTLEASIPEKLCIIGWTASTTTDMGATPFESRYVNVGTHAAIMNMILSQTFITEAPRWITAILALALPLGLVWLLRKAKPLAQIASGLASAIALLVVAFAIFATTGLYVKALFPAISIFMSFLVYALVEFFSTEREKSFLRKAFSTYLSGDVINQLLSNPENLKLGGQEKHMTALFTDVKGFSTISEALTAEQLVHLLNIYLSEMSDIILNNKGTIDKYEGDAIIGFFGAPLDYPDHAKAAVRSAIAMKRAEAAMNARLVEENLTPTPLLTRVGINTGSMVAGNMGTERKMNYTIMGSAVNLAARLEGVNKQYGTWILTTDATVNEAGDEFLFRRLDRVRVVGINTPVQLYEAVGIAAEIDGKDLEYFRDFEAALEIFEKKDWKGAKEAFLELSARRPDDGPNKKYVKHCDDFTHKPPVESWDGVFQLTEK
jgi:adenylate cyclase